MCETTLLICSHLFQHWILWTFQYTGFPLNFLRYFCSSRNRSVLPYTVRSVLESLESRTLLQDLVGPLTSTEDFLPSIQIHSSRFKAERLKPKIREYTKTVTSDTTKSTPVTLSLTGAVSRSHWVPRLTLKPWSWFEISGRFLGVTFSIRHQG